MNIVMILLVLLPLLFSAFIMDSIHKPPKNTVQNRPHARFSKKRGDFS